ncbi:apolipoprotein N-acyltransferase [Anabaena sphaerica FACHB-251]|uniref:Apolipoprotein N-acyltransferase n=1 Tax=Anabaena sphaerica FACHB-251 TaxID=2692883 RepID=A0A926WLA7_9NOST|nr:apolipoprotein N-acyltransferase [Anabaena sphaerica]MBD2296746.1 apolipoprotein N-acyltransferase [Anabaena sphaerica FACHB-251]
MKYLGKKLFSSFHLYTLSFISGILMGVTVAPFGAWFLAWFTLAPLWVLVVKNTTKKTILHAFLWAIAYHGIALSWLTGIHPMNWLGVPWWPSLFITIFCWSFISLWGGLLVSLWAFLMVRLDKQKPWLRILIGTALWCGLESLWSSGSLWWSSLAYTQSPHNLVILHLGQLSGPNTVTAVIVAVNGLVAESWIYFCTQRRRGAEEERKTSASLRFFNKYLISATILLITSHILGFILYSQPLNNNENSDLKIGVIQGNIPNEIKLLPQGYRKAITGYTNGYLQLASQGVDGVLTPEGALPLYERNFKNTPLLDAVKDKGVIAWIGGFGERGKSYTNSLFGVNSKGEVTSRYDKSKLVPLGEFVPFEEIVGALVQRLSPLDEHQVHGAKNQVFDTPLGRAIVGICYESAFSEIFRYQAFNGGQFILSSSNDAHYTAAMADQHHAQDIMRAIETDRWAVRATNTGYSAFVDPHGRTLWKSGYNSYETHAEIIYPRQTQTLYVRWGDWLMPLLLVLAFLGWVLL